MEEIDCASGWEGGMEAAGVRPHLLSWLKLKILFLATHLLLLCLFHFLSFAVGKVQLVPCLAWNMIQPFIHSLHCRELLFWLFVTVALKRPSSFTALCCCHLRHLVFDFVKTQFSHMCECDVGGLSGVASVMRDPIQYAQK